MDEEYIPPPTELEMRRMRDKRDLLAAKHGAGEKAAAHAKINYRRLRSISISGPEVAKEASKIHPKFAKNSRQSRTGFGKGKAKKGGAGGKGVWGAPGSELAVEDPASAVDARDPNYDSDSAGEVQLTAVPAQLTADELRRLTRALLKEYFEHGDTAEVDAALTDRRGSIGLQLRYLVVVVMVEVALDHKPSHREMTSVLLSDLYQQCLTQTDITRGFDALLEALPELVLDCPEAPQMLGNFLARCVADDCLPPRYLQSFKGRLECRHAIAALDRAELLTSINGGMARLDTVWGAGGPRRPVRTLINQMTLLLEEYLSSLDVDEAIRCLRELEVPHFHHELVYEAVTLAIERSDARSIQEVLRLLKTMFGACVLTTNQIEEGFARVYAAMPDTELDVPAAYSLLEQVVTLAFQKGIISRDTVRRMPAKGRKRFVSEGDGGLIKALRATGSTY